MRIRLAGWLLLLYCVMVAGIQAKSAEGDTIVTGWGYPNGPQFDFPAGLTNVLAISAGYSHVLALMPDHTVRAWGYDNYGATEVPESLTNATAIASGIYHNLALTSKGTVVQWGLNTPKKLALKNIIAIAAGDDFSVALQKAGTIKLWGNDTSVLKMPRGLKTVTAIAAGGSHVLALKKDGTVVSWGSNSYGQTNVPAGLSNVVMIAAGYNNSVALDARGVLWQWGQITQLSSIPNPQPTGIAQIAVGGYLVVVRTTNGTLTCWGASPAVFFPPGLTSASTIAAGQNNVFAAATGVVLRAENLGVATVLSGSNFTFSVTVDSPSPVQYQWYFNPVFAENDTNAVTLLQATNATLPFNSVRTNAAGYYWVIATNAFGSVTSSFGLVHVSSMNVLSLPQSQTILPAGNATLSISVESILPLRVQWYHDDNPLSYGTNAILTITNAHAADQGYYSVCVANDEQTRCLLTKAFLSVNPIWSIPPTSVIKTPGSPNFLRFTIVLSEARQDYTQIGYHTSGGGIDYLDVSGTATFPPGITNYFVDVPVLGRTNIGPITVPLFTDPYGLFRGTLGRGLILDPNYAPTVVMSSATIQEDEGPHVVSQSILLSGPASQPVTVNYSTVDGSALGGIDYVATNGQIVFLPPTISQQLSLTILGNVLKQPDRTFTVSFSQPVNASLTTNEISETILDDDSITVPPGFTTTLVATNFSYPSVLELAPDGRVFVGEQLGTVWVIKDGVRLPDPFMKVAASSAPSEGSESGLLGLAFDPGFATNHFVYAYYTTTSPYLHNRVSRFTADGDQVVPGSESVILDLNPLTYADNHNAGAIHFGPDGKLYVAVGDNHWGAYSQTQTNLLGKILRINPDGSIPTDNPFYATASGPNRAIWAMGLRNPFSFAFQPGTGRMLINDVGEDTWEEINSGSAGANYGWPLAEGPTNNPTFQNPIFAYTHTNGCAIVGSAFYNPDTPQFPDEYRSNYFFADYCGGWIHRLTPTNQAVDFIGGINIPIALQVSPDGALYCLCGTGPGGRVYKFTYSRSSRFEWARPLSDGRLQLRVSGAPNLPYTLESSTNLLFWEPLFTNTLPSAEWDFYDAPGLLPQRFYRLSQ